MVIVWLMMVNNNLIGGIPIPLKNMTPVGMMTFPTEWKNRKCSKPPTSLRTPTFHREKPWFSSGWLVDDDVPLMDMTGSNMFQICSSIPYDLPWFPSGETKRWESKKSCDVFQVNSTWLSRTFLEIWVVLEILGFLRFYIFYLWVERQKRNRG